MVSRACWKCQYVNKLESKYCEGKGCNYPQTQLALDEIKAAEEAKLQVLRDEILETRSAQQRKNQEIEMLKERMDMLGDMVMKLDPSVIYYRHELGWYTCKYPHPLTDKDRRDLMSAREQVSTHP